MSRRFKTRRKKNRRAATTATTVPTCSFRSSSQIHLVAAEIVRSDVVEASTGVAAEGVDDPEVALASRSGVVATDEFVVQTLQ
jgi:hypothetical protein